MCFHPHSLFRSLAPCAPGYSDGPLSIIENLLFSYKCFFSSIVSVSVVVGFRFVSTSILTVLELFHEILFAAGVMDSNCRRRSPGRRVQRNVRMLRSAQVPASRPNRLMAVRIGYDG